MLFIYRSESKSSYKLRYQVIINHYYGQVCVILCSRPFIVATWQSLVLDLGETKMGREAVKAAGNCRETIQAAAFWRHERACEAPD